MDIRVLKYFLAVAREESITRAAEQLHMSQPPLSRQLKDLEDELGKQLLVRGSRRVKLTEEGRILRRRAEEIINLVEKTEAEIMTASDEISGWLCIGGGETEGMRLLTKVLKGMRDDYPNLRFHLVSGNADEITAQLERGMLDFGLLLEPVDLTGYDFIRLPVTDHWGVLMRSDEPLAAKPYIQPEDLLQLPLLCSAQQMIQNELSGWMGGDYDRLRVIGEYNLLYNAALMVEEGVGSALCLDSVTCTCEGGPLCFRPLEPRLEVGMVLVWRKYHAFSKAARKFLERLTGDRMLNLQLPGPDTLPENH